MYIKGLVSVIIPSLNSGKYIAETVNSVLQQSYSLIEIIVVDDGSWDDTKLIVKKISKLNPRVRLVELDSNIGIGRARNIGQTLATGEYIAFCDSDDIWEKNKLQYQVDFLVNNNISFCSTAYKYVNSTGKYLNTFCPPVTVTYSSLLKSCDIGTSTVLYSKKKLGVLLMPNTKMKQDYLTWLTLLRDLGSIKTISTPLVRIRKHQSSISYNKFRALKYQYKALLLHCGYSKLNINLYFYLFNYIVSGIRKHKIK